MNNNIEQIKELLMKAKISPSFYDEYLKNAEIIEVSENQYVCIVSTFAKTVAKDIEKWVLNNFRKLTNNKVGFSFQTKEEYESNNIKKRINDKNNSQLPTFENFVEGPSNKAALAAAKSTITEYCRYNPLFIYGNSGLGKTHLLNAIKNKVEEEGTKKAIYITSETFRDEIVRSINNEKRIKLIEDFKEKYTNVDYFLLDDVHFFSSNTKTLEILFNIFNDLIKNNRQIVMTSDKFVEQLNGFEKRMISRFISGLNIQIHSLDQETSMNILKYKLDNSNFEIEEEALKYIASFYSGDVRKLNGIFNQIDFNIIQGVISSPVSLKDLDKILNSYTLISAENINVSTIKNVVAKEYNTTVEMLVGKSRTQPLAFARHVAITLCRDVLKLNNTRIGNEFGGRDHSTVLNAFEKVNEKLSTDKAFKKTWKNLLKKLGQ